MTKNASEKLLDAARKAALEVLRHNAHGTYRGLPRTAGWGYPEPYTRDLMISSLGILVSGDQKLLKVLKKTLETAARNQSSLGHIPSLVHDPEDRGSSDCTPLFLMAVGMYRLHTGDRDFLHDAVEKAMTWVRYQSPSDRMLIAQLPTTDWRDEQWVLGYGLFVNTVVYAYLRMLGDREYAEEFRERMTHFAVRGDRQHHHVHEGLVLPHKPYFAFWSFKIYSSERFDLLGNSLAILTGIASPTRTKSLTTWIEIECDYMKKNGLLAVDLPPNFFPFIQEHDPDWLPRYKKYNMPGEYHNGGIWPFICGFYVAALVAAGRQNLAEEKLLALARLNKPAREQDVAFGFNEWHQAQTGQPMGQDWQTWSAAMYLYADHCVRTRTTPFFDEIRKRRPRKS